MVGVVTTRRNHALDRPMVSGVLILEKPSSCTLLERSRTKSATSPREISAIIDAGRSLTDSSSQLGSSPPQRQATHWSLLQQV